MSDDDTSLAPDCIAGAPHPRDTPVLFGQTDAEETFLTSYNAGRLHHGWLLAGPKGVGKATLAWRIARFLLATPEAEEGGLFSDPLPAPTNLDIPVDHPVSRRLVAGSDPGFFHIIRKVNEKTGRLRDRILAEDVRDLNQFLQLSATDGGRRVVLIDSADEMNPQASNALLKMLEEPPPRTVFLLITHQPARLLPTIRSRCRELRLAMLGPEDMARALEQAGGQTDGDAQAVAQLSGGSVGEALRLLKSDGLDLYRQLIDIVGTLPSLERVAAVRLANQSAARGAEDRLDLLFVLVDVMLARMARAGALGQPLPEAAPGEAEVFKRLAPTQARARDWATAAQEIGTRSRHGRSVNLDPAALVLDTVLKLHACARS